MARTTKNDELNILETFTKYFSEMSLSDEEIGERIGFAQRVYSVIERAFQIIKAESTIDRGFDENYLLEFISREYADILFEYEVPEYIYEYATKNIKIYLDTTLRNATTEYYLSPQRAVEIAETETNDYLNYKQFETMKAQGFKFKRWDTMQDERVRHTHVMADGQTCLINVPFKVGISDMMFPLDGSLGAGADEIVNCRCVCHYFN